MRLSRFVTLVAVVCAYAAPHARADEVYTFVVKKQEEKAKSRWSLAEWLETRDRMRLMDLWLALHTPSPYEFILGGEYRLANVSPAPATGGDLRPWRAEFTAYASIFGLGLQRGFSPEEEWLGAFYLRVFGFHAQDTNITLQAGVRSESKPYDLRNAFGGAGLTIYLSRYFGIDGFWRHHFDSVPNVANGMRISGNHYEGGAFVDFKFLRVYGNYFSKPETVVTALGSADTSETGCAFGAKFYF